MPANDADLDMLAALVGLDIPPEYREGVATQFQALKVQAELVLSFPLTEEVEPAPVFTP
jgi:hypothetical protein